MTNYDREKIVVSKQWLVVREKDDNVRGNCHAGLVSASVVDDGVKDAIVTLEARSADRVHYFLHGSYRLRLQDDSFVNDRLQNDNNPNHSQHSPSYCLPPTNHNRQDFTGSFTTFRMTHPQQLLLLSYRLLTTNH